MVEVMGSSPVEISLNQFKLQFNCEDNFSYLLFTAVHI